MSDHYAGSIKLPDWALDIPEIQKELEGEFGFHGDLLNLSDGCDASKIDNIIVFSNDSAYYGYFGELEAACAKLGIPYDRWSDSYFECNSETAYFRPELPEIEYADGEGRFYIDCSDIQSILDSKNLKENLMKLLPPVITPLKEYKEMPKKLKKSLGLGKQSDKIKGKKKSASKADSR